MFEQRKARRDRPNGKSVWQDEDRGRGVATRLESGVEEDGTSVVRNKKIIDVLLPCPVKEESLWTELRGEVTTFSEKLEGP